MMKTTYLKLLRDAVLLMACMLITVAVNDLYGQNIERNIANKEARKFRDEAGFERISFSKNTLLEILNNAEAIALYNGLPRKNARKAVLMLIGLNADGTQIGNTFKQSDTNSLERDLSRADKESQVANAESNRRITAFKTSFGKADLLNLLNALGLERIEFLPIKSTDATGNEILTLTASPIGTSTEVMQMQSFRSPCPPECFEDDGEN